MNTSFNERIHPDNSFTMGCELKLHNNSTNRYETIRKDLLLLLLPDARTLFDVSQKSAVPLGCFLRDASTSPHCNILKKFAEIMSKLDNNNVLKEERNNFKLIMALHIDEINIQARHLFRNESLFGTS